MGKNRAFEREYSLNVARLTNGANQEFFEIRDDFFEHQTHSLVKNGNLNVRLDIEKYNTHLDTIFHFEGTVVLECDRCTKAYNHQIKSEHRIIYSFDDDMKFEGYEVMYVKSQEPNLVIIQELYDFINLSIPIRKVPEPEVHICSPEVLKMLGLDENGEVVAESDDKKEEAIDPRWAELKKLKDKLKD